MLSFLRETPEDRLDRVGSEIRGFDRSINMSDYVGKTPARLARMIEKLREDQDRTKRTSKYGSWLNDEKYIARSLMIEGLEAAKEIRETRENSEQLIPGQVVYKDVMEFDNVLVGKRAHVIENEIVGWVDFSERTPVQKALEVLRYGSPEDFQSIYVEMANGRPDAMLDVQVRHITESSDEVLAEIEKYCDSRWEGEWPWEANTPYRVETLIEEQNNMRIADVTIMQGRFNSLLKRLNEDEMSKWEVIGSLTDMEKQVDSMISDVAKLSAAGIEAGAKASSVLSPEVGQQIEQAWQGVVNSAATSLSGVKAKIAEIRQQVEASSGDSMGGSPIGGGMGMGDGEMSPDDAMGGDPAMGDPAMGGGDMDSIDNMADVPLDHEKDERAIKPL